MTAAAAATPGNLAKLAAACLCAEAGRHAAQKHCARSGATHARGTRRAGVVQPICGHGGGVWVHSGGHVLCVEGCWHRKRAPMSAHTQS